MKNLLILLILASITLPASAQTIRKGSDGSVTVFHKDGTSDGLAKKRGVTDGSNACTGCVGEYIQGSATVVNAGASSAWKTITSVTLTPGDWDISAMGTLSTNSATLSGLNTIAIGTTSDADPSLPVGTSLGLARFNQGVGSSSFSAATLSGYRVQPTVTTTYYLLGQVAYSAGTPQWRGIIGARRTVVTK